MEDKDDLTASNRVWLHFLRENSQDSDLEPTLRLVPLLRSICELRRS